MSLGIPLQNSLHRTFIESSQSTPQKIIVAFLLLLNFLRSFLLETETVQLHLHFI